MTDRKKAYEWGEKAEQLAYEHLIREGYAIRERRRRQGSGHGEIDIIAELPGVMVFVEVKARTPYPDEPREHWQEDPLAPADAVTLRKQRLIARTADSYLRAIDADYEYRFDIIAIVGTEADYELAHVPDAFLSPVSTR